VTYRPDIDGLRGIAVLLVLCFHAQLGFPGGYVGVDVFFVLSGYLITGVILSGLDRGTFSLVDFWRRRIARIAPAATVTTVLTLAAGWFLLLPDDLAKLASSAAASQVALANLYFAERVGYFAGPAELKPLLHMWSLAVEEQFYLIYPFLLVFLHRFGPGILTASLATVAIASFAYGVHRLETHPSACFFLLPSRGWELALGGLAYRWPPIAGSRVRIRTALSFLGLACVSAAAIAYTPETPYPGAAALMPCVGTALLLHAGGSGTVVDRMLSLRGVVFVGLISYSLYLVHWPLLALLRNEYGRVLPTPVLAAAIVASFGLAAASWKLVETPFRRLGATRPFGPVAVAFAGSVLLVAGGSAAIRRFDGLPGRFPEDIARIHRAPRGDRSQERSIVQVRADDLPTFGSRDGEIDCLLWGDSHARAQTRAFREACDRLGLSGATATRLATLPLLEVWRAGKRDETTAWNDAVLEFVRRNRIRLVVLAGQWSANVEEEPGFGGRRKIVTDARSDARGPEDAERVVRESLARTVEALREAGASVVILREFPQQPVDARRLLARELRTGTPSPLLARRSDHERRQARTDRAFEAIAARDGVRVIDPAPRLFGGDGPEARSIVGDRNGCHYFDDHHPSAYGSSRIVSADLEEAIRSLLR